ncbi:MAG: hypothetical protein IMZ47_09425, partial [Firmicutes bacterium]|nr:hypothetical protein [Bacillota bacterium]
MTRQIKIPIYYGYLILHQNVPMEKVCKDYGWKNGDFDAISGRDIGRNGVYGYIMAFEKCSPSIIAHEADHIAFRIMKDRGIGIGSSNEEVHAYLVGW